MTAKERQALKDALMDLRSIDGPTPWDSYIDSSIKTLTEILEQGAGEDE